VEHKGRSYNCGDVERHASGASTGEATNAQAYFLNGDADRNIFDACDEAELLTELCDYECGYDNYKKVTGQPKKIDLGFDLSETTATECLPDAPHPEEFENAQHSLQNVDAILENRLCRNNGVGVSTTPTKQSVESCRARWPSIPYDYKEIPFVPPSFPADWTKEWGWYKYKGYNEGAPADYRDTFPEWMVGKSPSTPAPAPTQTFNTMGGNTMD